MLIVDGIGLTAADIARVARAGRAPGAVQLAPSARERIARSHAFAAEVAAERPIYGRSTGVGANRTVPVTDLDGQAGRLLRSHATAAGPLRSAERVRALLLVRLNQLAAGGSGVSPDVADALAAMIDADALPPVREWGSIGTGDLSALAATALTLQGELAASRPLTHAPVVVRDALPFISSNAATIADAALALVDLRTLAAAAVVVGALTVAAVDGNPEAFSTAAEAAVPFPGARLVSSSLRGLVEGGGVPARIQDPFALRTMPAVHGAFVDSLARLDSTVSAIANAPSENPAFLPDLGVAHHGGFHGAYLAQALDAAVLAAAQSALLSTRRLALLVDPAYTGLTSFLADGPPGSSGVMVLEYVAASALGALRALASPASLQSVTISNGTEDDASFASLAAGQALEAVAAYRTVIAGELVASVRALRLRTRAGGFVRPPALDATDPVLAALDARSEDRDLAPDVAAAEAALDVLAQLNSVAEIMRPPRTHPPG